MGKMQRLYCSKCGEELLYSTYQARQDPEFFKREHICVDCHNEKNNEENRKKDE